MIQPRQQQQQQRHSLNSSFRTLTRNKIRLNYFKTANPVKIMSLPELAKQKKTTETRSQKLSSTVTKVCRFCYDESSEYNHARYSLKNSNCCFGVPEKSKTLKTLQKSTTTTSLKLDYPAYRGMFTYLPRGLNELEIQPDDVVVVPSTKIYKNSNLWYGINTRTKMKGFFPPEFVYKTDTIKSSCDTFSL